MSEKPDLDEILRHVQVVSDEEAEECTFVVCVLASKTTPFTDNEIGECCRCQRAVQFRPHAPKKPPRICMECVVKESPH